VVDAGLELRSFDLAFRSDRDDRQVDMAVGEIGRCADAVDDFQAKPSV